MTAETWPRDAADPDALFSRERTTSEVNQLVAHRISIFRRIFIPYPRHTEFHARCDYLLELGQLTKGEPQRGMRVLAPSGSGKTTAAKAFIELVERRLPPKPNFIPALHVSLDRAATPKKLYTSILLKFGDGFGHRGTELELRERLLTYFDRFGCRLLFIDEVQHLNRTNSGDVTDSLKALLDEGAVPIVFLGTEDAEAMFSRNLQLNGRLVPPCDFTRLRSTVQEDARLLRGYWERLDWEIVRLGLRDQSSGLFDPDFLGALHKVSDGVIGRVSRLMEAALEISIRRAAAKIELRDVALATDRWALPQKFASTNPFWDLVP